MLRIARVILTDFPIQIGKIPSSNTEGYGLYIGSGGSITASSAIYYCKTKNVSGTITGTLQCASGCACTN